MSKNWRRLLSEVHEMVSEIQENQNAESKRFCDFEPRIEVTEDNHYGEVLTIIDEFGPITFGDVKRRSDRDIASRTATRLYQSYMVDREKPKNDYEYTITELGKRALENCMSDDQEELKNYSRPWDDEDLNEGEYYALQSVANSNGHCTSSELNGDYLERANKKPSDGSSFLVAPRLSNLYKKGFVNRPPEQPYYYWVTEKGKEILND